ncbi:flagellin N-terminal helical domain-containing protein [Sulfurospirillum cavolei]|uniref:flagellin N-terminal helical domain-containing protein n=1 Tax=Sulfurospirillum cavolei TaxID=366522 RepID=UPI0005AB7C0D|nr:flagellin [Sulfurospirillum cavolei]
MGFRINTNTAALTAHTSATMNNRSLDNSLAKLSSGLRINKAADDASGLAIADSLRSQASSLAQAVSNGNDAIGLIQTADGALNEYSSILDTIKTKATQAASDGQNSTTRLAIQKDIDKLMEELNIIAKTTSFNGQKLLSGTFKNKEFQMGANANESVKVSIASAETNQIGQTSRAVLNAGSDQGGAIQLTLKSAQTGKSLTLKTVDIQYNNDVQNGMGALADEINRYAGETGISAKAVVSSAATTAVSAGATGSDFAINGVNIGAVNVAANDNDGTLVNAINSKTTQTGVTASMSSDGKLTLTSDGRSIKVEGDTSVLGATAKEMSTVGHIELVQNGSSQFQIEGIGAGAVGAKIYTSGTTSMLKDSVLAAGSIIQGSSTLKAGTEIGGNVYTSTTKTMTLDSTLKAGSILTSTTILKAGTQMGGSVTISATAATQALTKDMLLTAGSTLASNTVLGAGTVIQQDFTDAASVEHKAGEVLTSTAIIAPGGLTLSKDMVLKYDSVAANNSKIATASIVNVGSILGGDFGVASGTTVTLAQDMVVKGGSTLGDATKVMAGSVLGGDIITTGSTTTYLATNLKAGSILGSSSMLAQGSTIGGQVTVNGNTSLTDDMTIKAGSTLKLGTIFKAGTILNQDMKLATAPASAASVDLKAGSVLTSDMYVGNGASDAITLSEDMVLLKGTGTVGAIGDLSTLMPNDQNSGSVGLSDEEFTNLSDINVTTLEGAMKAIDTVSAAISNLDAIRSDLGSVQNQVTSTINNISVTQVNVKAAESNIRDVDFAAESANFSKFNILAQSGSYAMSQANSVQQNVLKLLQ